MTIFGQQHEFSSFYCLGGLLVGLNDSHIHLVTGAVFYTLGGFERHKDYVWYMEKYNVGSWNFAASKRYTPLIQQFYEKQVSILNHLEYLI